MTTPRPKPPAYARALLQERREGRHPRQITLVYGNDWRAGDAPRICLKPADYEPGRFDFRVVAGCKVIVLDQEMGAAELDRYVRPTKWGKAYDLFGELAAAGAYVEVAWPERSGWPSVTLDALAAGFDGRQRPPWWSEEREQRHQAAQIGWLEDRGAEIRAMINTNNPNGEGERAGAA